MRIDFCGLLRAAVKILKFTEFATIGLMLINWVSSLRTYTKNPVSSENRRFFREILTQKPGF
jgi:hypothetical protein